MEVKLKLLEELKLRFPMKDVSPYGECIVVPGVDFDPDWDSELGDRGYKCINTDVGGKAVTLVSLKKSVVEEGEKVVYVPPKPVAVPGSAVLNLESRWTEKDDARLVKLWNLEPRMIISGIAGNFPKRTLSAVANELERLREDNRIKPRVNTGQPRKVKKKTPQKIIDYAIELSESTDPAHSSRDIAEMIATRFGVEVSNVAVQNWIVEAASPVEGEKTVSSPAKAEAKGKKQALIPGARSPPSQKWRPEEDEVLVKLWNEGGLIEKMTPSFPGRTEAAVRLRIQRLEKYGKIKKRTGHPKVSLPKSVRAIKPKRKAGEDIHSRSDASVEKSVPPVPPIPPPPDSLTDLLKQILDAIKSQEESVCFECYCPYCRERRSVEDSNVWKACPVCGGSLIVWDVKVSTSMVYS